MMDDKQHPFSCVEEAELCFRHFDETSSYLEAIIKPSLFPEDKVWSESKVLVSLFIVEAGWCRFSR